MTQDEMEALIAKLKKDLLSAETELDELRRKIKEGGAPKAEAKADDARVKALEAAVEDLRNQLDEERRKAQAAALKGEDDDGW